MYRLQRSALFKRQLLHFVKNYKERAGTQVAARFIESLEQSISFICSTNIERRDLEKVSLL